jgi:hypothetical protein
MAPAAQLAGAPEEPQGRLITLTFSMSVKSQSPGGRGLPRQGALTPSLPVSRAERNRYSCVATAGKNNFGKIIPGRNSRISFPAFPRFFQDFGK